MYCCIEYPLVRALFSGVCTHVMQLLFLCRKIGGKIMKELSRRKFLDVYERVKNIADFESLFLVPSIYTSAPTHSTCYTL